MAELLLFFSIFLSLIGDVYSEYCTYYYGSFYSSSYSFYCPFGCCGTTNLRYCCVNIGYIVGIVIGVLVFLAFVIITSCCCVRRRRLQATQTTVVTGAQPSAYIYSNTSNSAAQYPAVNYTTNYAYMPDQNQQSTGMMYPNYPTYPPNQEFDPVKSQMPPSYDSSYPPSYSSPVN